MAIERRLFPLGGAVTNSPQYFQHYSITFAYRKNRFEVWDDFDFSYEDDFLEMLPGPLVEMNYGTTNELIVSKVSPVNVWANFGIKKVKFVSDDPDVELTFQIPGTTNQINLSNGQEEIHQDLPKALAAGGEHLGFRKKNPDGTWFNMITPKHFMTGSHNNAAVPEAKTYNEIDFTNLVKLSEATPIRGNDLALASLKIEFQIYQKTEHAHLTFKDHDGNVLNQYFYEFGTGENGNGVWYVDPNNFTRYADIVSLQSQVPVMAWIYRPDGSFDFDSSVGIMDPLPKTFRHDQPNEYPLELLKNNEDIWRMSWFGMSSRKSLPNPLMPAEPGIISNHMIDFDRLYPLSKTEPGWSQNESTSPPSGQFEYVAVNSSITYELKDCENGRHLAIKMFSQSENKEITLNDYYYRYDWTNVENSRWYAEPGKYRLFDLHSNFVYNGSIMVMGRAFMHDGAEYRPEGAPDAYYAMSMYLPDQTGAFFATMLPNDAHPMLTSLNNLGIYFGKDGQNMNPLFHSIPLPENIGRETFESVDISEMTLVDAIGPSDTIDLFTDSLTLQVQRYTDKSLKVSYYIPGPTSEYDKKLGTFAYKNGGWYVKPEEYISWNFITTSDRIQILANSFLPDGEIDTLGGASLQVPGQAGSRFYPDEWTNGYLDGVKNGQWVFYQHSPDNFSNHINHTDPLMKPLTNENIVIPLDKSEMFETYSPNFTPPLYSLGDKTKSVLALSAAHITAVIVNNASAQYSKICFYDADMQYIRDVYNNLKTNSTYQSKLDARLLSEFIWDWPKDGSGNKVYATKNYKSYNYTNPETQVQFGFLSYDKDYNLSTNPQDILEAKPYGTLTATNPIYQFPPVMAGPLLMSTILNFKTSTGQELSFGKNPLFPQLFPYTNYLKFVLSGEYQTNERLKIYYFQDVPQNAVPTEHSSTPTLAIYNRSQVTRQFLYGHSDPYLYNDFISPPVIEQIMLVDNRTNIDTYTKATSLQFINGSGVLVENIEEGVNWSASAHGKVSSYISDFVLNPMEKTGAPIRMRIRFGPAGMYEETFELPPISNVFPDLTDPDVGTTPV